MKIFVALRFRFRRARRRRERNAVAFSSNSNASSLTSPVSFVSGHRRLGKTQRTRAFPLVGRALRSLRLWAQSVDGGQKQAATKEVTRRGKNETTPPRRGQQKQHVEEDFSRGRHRLVQTGTFSIVIIIVSFATKGKSARGNPSNKKEKCLCHVCRVFSERITSRIFFS